MRLEFGDYDGHSPQPLDAYSSLTINCRAIPGEGSIRNAIIQINRGSSPSFQRREMVGPGGVIHYNVYIDATRQTIWGDGSGGTDFVHIDRPQPNQDLTFPVYGRVDALQALAAGRYQDMLTVSVIF